MNNMQATELMNVLFDCNNQRRKAIGRVNIDGTVLSGTINSLDRSGANHIAIGFPLTNGLSLKWSGRKYESRVKELSPGHFQIIDTGILLEIELVEREDTTTENDPPEPEDAVTRHLRTPFCP